MANIALNDLFPGGSLDAQWTVDGGATITIASGDCTINDAAGGIVSTNTFAFAGNRLAWKIKGTKPDFFLVTIGTAGMLAPMMQWQSGAWTCGAATFAFPGYKTNYGNYASGSSNEWASIRHDGAGNIIYSTSGDSTNGSDGTWTDHHTQANASDFSASKVSFILDTNGGAAVDFVIDRIGVSGGGGGGTIQQKGTMVFGLAQRARQDAEEEAARRTLANFQFSGIAWFSAPRFPKAQVFGAYRRREQDELDDAQRRLLGRYIRRTKQVVATPSVRPRFPYAQVFGASQRRMADEEYDRQRTVRYFKQTVPARGAPFVPYTPPADDGRDVLRVRRHRLGNRGGKS